MSSNKEQIENAISEAFEESEGLDAIIQAAEETGEEPSDIAKKAGKRTSRERFKISNHICKQIIKHTYYGDGYIEDALTEYLELIKKTGGIVPQFKTIEDAKQLYRELVDSGMHEGMARHQAENLVPRLWQKELKIKQALQAVGYTFSKKKKPKDHIQGVYVREYDGIIIDKAVSNMGKKIRDFIHKKKDTDIYTVDYTEIANKLKFELMGLPKLETFDKDGNII